MLSVSLLVFAALVWLYPDSTEVGFRGVEGEEVEAVGARREDICI